jgi:hypothetical protein
MKLTSSMIQQLKQPNKSWKLTLTAKPQWILHTNLTPGIPKFTTQIPQNTQHVQ